MFFLGLLLGSLFNTTSVPSGIYEFKKKERELLDEVRHNIAGNAYFHAKLLGKSEEEAKLAEELSYIDLMGKP